LSIIFAHRNLNTACAVFAKTRVVNTTGMQPRLI